MPPANSSKKKFSMKSFASPKTRTTPDPEALHRLMEKTEVDGGGVLNPETNSEIVAKPPTAPATVAPAAACSASSQDHRHHWCSCTVTPHCDLSIAAAGYRLGIPVTLHVSIGSDIIHAMPNCNVAAFG